MDGPDGGPEVARAFADTLLQLLDSLTEPIVPASLHAKCAETANRDEAFEVNGSPSRNRGLYSLWNVRLQLLD